MPIYEYRCASCGAELEKLQKISDPPLLECPECGKDTLVKLVSASSFRLKGSGWYETDFKTGKKKNGVGDAAADSTDAAGKATGNDSTAADTTKAASKDSAKSADGVADSKSSDKASAKEAAKGSGGSATGTAAKPAPQA